MRRKSGIVFLSLFLAAALLGACADQRTPIGTPHPLGKKWIVQSDTSHGAAFRAGEMKCSECHDLDTFCNDCHFGTGGSRVPPGVEWTHGTIPHDFLRPYESVCNNCHGLLRRFEGEPADCHNCHGEGAGHPRGRAWLDPTSPTFHGNSSLDCTVCHDVNTFCFGCHFGPTGSKTPEGMANWTHDTARKSHAAASLFTSTQEAICIDCHQLTKSYNLGPQFTDCSTATCHGFDYHGVGFFDAHPAAANQDLSKCGPCHNTPGTPPNFDGYVTGVACATCHSNALAHPPPPATTPDWYVSHRTAGRADVRAAACGICHNTTGPGAGPMPGAPSCFSAEFDGRSCHAGGPGTAPHPLDKAWYIPTAGSPFHGTSTLPCQDCHDPNTFCFECHFGPTGTRVPPGVTGWNHTTPLTGHAALNIFTTPQKAVCIQCHTVENRYASFPPGSQFLDCSTATCHGFDYHGAGFFTAHPAAAKANLLACQPCHDTPGGTPNFNGFVTGVACANCHSDALAHPPPPTSVNWVSEHQTAGNKPAACAICHKVDGPGTGPLPAAPSCFSADFDGTACHAGGPPVNHPAGFADPAQHGVQAKAGVPSGTGLVYCQQCHANPPASGPGSNPRFNVTKSTLPSGCETCHNDLTAHPSTGGRDTVHWYGTFFHADAQNMTVACALCHGVALGGGNGPACSQCHTAASPIGTLGTCVSCHGAPPSGASAPNVAGAHAPHDALPGVTGQCNTCHNGAGNRTANHFNQTIDVAFLAAYNAKTGAATRTPATGTCSNVSCHGGVTTPVWLTGSLNVDTDCTSCHIRGTAAQSPQFNSPYSGQHNRGGHVSAGCTACHDPAKLQPANTRHFSNLATPAFETSPATTLQNSLNYNGSSCDPSCHGRENWSGG